MAAGAGTSMLLLLFSILSTLVTCAPVGSFSNSTTISISDTTTNINPSTVGVASLDDSPSVVTSTAMVWVSSTASWNAGSATGGASSTWSWPLPAASQASPIASSDAAATSPAGAPPDTASTGPPLPPATPPPSSASPTTSTSSLLTSYWPDGPWGSASSWTWSTRTISRTVSRVASTSTSMTTTFTTESTAPNDPPSAQATTGAAETSQSAESPGVASTSPSASSVPAPSTPASSSATLKLNFVNNLGKSGVHAYLTGTVNDKLAMLTNDNTWYYPETSGATPANIPDSANVALSLSAGKNEFKIPNYVSAARIWVAHGKIVFQVTNDGGLVEPSSANPDDPNNDTNWGFVELTYGSEEDGGLYANLSFVDFLGMPLGIKMLAAGNITQSALGPHANATAAVCEALKEQEAQDGQPWGQLCDTDSEGNLIRVLSPQTYLTRNETAFDTYFEEYIDAIWELYSSSPLKFATQSSAGDIECTTSGNTMSCTGGGGEFARPTTQDIIGCNTGPFANTDANGDVHLSIVPRLCAAFNRATLHIPGGNLQPSVPPSRYYDPPVTNFYSKLVHTHELDGKGYAFSYDDVTPNSDFDTAGVVAAANPTQLTVYIGGANASSRN